MSISVVIVDDHHLVREAIRSLLARHSDIEVRGEGSNGDEAMSLVEACSPDVLLIDLAMPAMNGVEAVTQIVNRHPTMKALEIGRAHV